MMQQNILDFLHRLAAAQKQTVEVLKKKQELLVKPEKEALEKIKAEEVEVLNLLKRALEQREEILIEAGKQGFTETTIEELCHRFFPTQPAQDEVRRLIEASRCQSERIRLLAHVNWTMTQKSLIHLSQILELIETRGQGKTTYKPQKGHDDSASTGGGFVDRVA